MAKPRKEVIDNPHSTRMLLLITVTRGTTPVKIQHGMMQYRIIHPYNTSSKIRKYRLQHDLREKLSHSAVSQSLKRLTREGYLKALREDTQAKYEVNFLKIGSDIIQKAKQQFDSLMHEQIMEAQTNQERMLNHWQKKNKHCPREERLSDLTKQHMEGVLIFNEAIHHLGNTIFQKLKEPSKELVAWIRTYFEHYANQQIDGTSKLLTMHELYKNFVSGTPYFSRALEKKLDTLDKTKCLSRFVLVCDLLRAMTSSTNEVGMALTFSLRGSEKGKKGIPSEKEQSVHDLIFPRMILNTKAGKNVPLVDSILKPLKRAAD